MRYITEKDMEIFRESEKLRDEWARLENEWHAQVEESYKGKMDYSNTKQKFDEYLAAFEKWKEFQNKHSEILLPSIVQN